MKFSQYLEGQDLYKLWWTIIFKHVSEFLALLERLVRSKQNCAKNFEAKCSVRHSPLSEAERSVRDALGFRECLFLFRDGGHDDRIWEHRAFHPNWQAFYARIQLDRHPLFRNFNGTGRERVFWTSISKSHSTSCKRVLSEDIKRGVNNIKERIRRQFDVCPKYIAQWIYIGFGVVSLILIPSFIFRYFESWSLFDAVYFSLMIG